MNRLRFEDADPLGARIARQTLKYQRAVLNRCRKTGRLRLEQVPEPINYDFRPESYGQITGVPQILANIKGAARKRMALKLLAEGRLDEMPDHLLVDKLTDADRIALGRLDHALMGGEYLPDNNADEVEIARVDLESMTHDVISLRARPVVGGIAYQVVDEYESQYRIAPRFSEQPLTLRQLIRLLDRADSPELGGMTLGILEMNRENGATAEELLDFLAVSSEYYPDLRQHYWFRIRHWLWQRKTRA